MKTILFKSQKWYYQKSNLWVSPLPAGVPPPPPPPPEEPPPPPPLPLPPPIIFHKNPREKEDILRETVLRLWSYMDGMKEVIEGKMLTKAFIQHH